MIGQRLGDYVLEAELGRGGMGVVYRARSTKTERNVAIKLLSPSTDTELIERFLREAEAAARLRHPNVVAIHEVGQTQGRRFLVMDLIEGRSLLDRLREGPLEPEAAAELTAALCDALEAAHQAGLVHRDVKPANVMLDEAGRPLLTDFGIALQVDRETRLSRTGDVLGTPAYMAPEQATSGMVDQRTDVYGAGATLFNLLSGQAPFEGTPLVVMHAVVNAAPPPLPGVDPALEAIVRKALAKAPADRYTTAAEMAAALRAWCRGEGGVLSRWPVWAAGAAGVVALAVLATRGVPPESATPSPPAALTAVAAASFDPAAFMELPAGQRLAARVPTEDWPALARVICRRALEHPIERERNTLTLLELGPNPEAVGAAKTAQLELDAERWGEALRRDPALVERLAKIGGTPPHVRAGPKLQRVLRELLAEWVECRRRSGVTRAELLAVARREQTIFYGIDPRPLSTPGYMALLREALLGLTDQDRSPQIRLIKIRYRFLQQPVQSYGPWLDQLLARYPRSRLRRARAWWTKRAAAETPEQYLELARALAELAGEDALDDLHPRFLLRQLETLVADLARLAKSKTARAKATSRAIAETLEPVARRLVEVLAKLRTTVLGGEFPRSVDFHARLARITGGVPRALQALAHGMKHLERRPVVPRDSFQGRHDPVVEKALAKSRLWRLEAVLRAWPNGRGQPVVEAERPRALALLRRALEHNLNRCPNATDRAVTRTDLAALLRRDDPRAALRALEERSTERFRHPPYVRLKVQLHWGRKEWDAAVAEAEAALRWAKQMPDEPVSVTYYSGLFERALRRKRSGR